MSEFHVEVVRLGAIEKHPNADALQITQVHGGYPCISQLGAFAEGDLAVYVPVDAIVDTARPEFTFLAGSNVPGKPHRVRAKRLRGIFSMGLLIPAPAGASEGDDVCVQLGITKWEPPADRINTSSPATPSPGGLPIPVYDLEGLRRHLNASEPVLVDGEEVVITEKIHGANARIVITADGVVHVGSRNQWKREDADDLWWPALRASGLVDTLQDAAPSLDGLVLYGEVFGQVQDLTYGHERGTAARFRLFDAYRTETGTWYDHDTLEQFARLANVDMVPVLYRGPWSRDLLSLAEGPSTLASHTREGFVVRPVKERFHRRVGRVVLKMVGEGYLTRKAA